MRNRGIVLKIGSTIMVLFLVVLLPLGFVIDRIFLQIYSTEVHQKVNEMSNNITDQLVQSPSTSSSFLNHVRLVTGKKIVAFDQNGVITSESVFEYKRQSVIGQDIIQLMMQGKHFEREYVDTLTNEHYFYVGRPIMKGEQLQGGILIFSSIDEIHQTIHLIRRWIIGSVLTAILLAVGYTLFVSRRLSKPLIDMESITRSIAKGDLTSRVSITTKDELGSLGQAINDLSVELNHFRSNRSELLANISHELRTPISYLKGYAQLIRKHQYKSNAELEEFSSIIVNESDHLAKLIQDLFELSKMEEGQIKLYTQSVDVEDLVESAVRKVSLNAAKKNLSIHSQIEDHLPSIVSDGSRLEQIILNLLENAIHYTHVGEITVWMRQTKEEILISIIDSGIGIPEADLPFIFDRFHRVDKSRSRDSGGTGLGLAIVSKLVTLLQGEINVTSTLGVGTSFEIALPKVFNHDEKNHG